MQAIHENLVNHIKLNNQLLAFVRYASRVRHVTILGAGNGLSLLAAMAAKPEFVRLYDPVLQDTQQYREVCASENINFAFNVCDLNSAEIEPTDLLYIDTHSEGNIKYTELKKYQSSVSRYMLVNNTYTHAHDAVTGIELSNGIQPCGVIHGINSFISECPNWHILEHLYYDPGLTVLYNRRDIHDDGR
jgi:hypothetical protein